MTNIKFIIPTITAFLIAATVIYFSILKENSSTYCTKSNSCIEISSKWRSAPALQGNNSIMLIKNNSETMDLYFFSAQDLKPQDSDLSPQANHPWGTVTKVIENSTFYERFNKAGFLTDRLYIPQWGAFVKCDEPTCLNDIKGFSIK